MTADTGMGELDALASGSRERHDLFIGLVAPIGSDRDEVLAELKSQLREYGYEMDRIHLAGLLGDLPGRVALPSSSDPDYYRAHMDAGDELRRIAGGSAVAALGISSIVRCRDSAPDQPTAYVFDSLKHPAEARLLRRVYGPGFWLVSVVQDLDERLQNLQDLLATQRGSFLGDGDTMPAELISRDQADGLIDHGQQVRDVFAAADFFLPVRRGDRWRDDVARFLTGVFDAPFLTPLLDEDAMRQAQVAALRSAALGRQVGAAIVTAGTDPILLGANEVPKPGGGQFREGDTPDFRDFATGQDPNSSYVNRLLTEVFEKLAKAKYFNDAHNALGGAQVLAECLKKNNGEPAVLDNTRAKSLIEFTRCLHAEQAAIVSAARTGIALQGSVLYTTTFPCHECTKFIIGAGIIEVRYIEPYPKSMAGELYRDLIDTNPPTKRDGDNSIPFNKVPFRPFVGFGPGRYDEVFAAGKRKQGSQVVEYDKLKATPVGTGWNGTGVSQLEDEVVTAVVRMTGPDDFVEHAVAETGSNAEPQPDTPASNQADADSGEEHVSG